MSRSLFLIKPDGMPSVVEIKRIIEVSSGLKLVAARKVQLREQHVADLYPHVATESGPLWFATLGHMLAAPCEFGVVAGANAVERLIEVCGRHTNPSECAPGTIRKNYRKEAGISLPDGRTYFFNVVHRSREDELERDLQVLRALAPPGFLT